MVASMQTINSQKVMKVKQFTFITHFLPPQNFEAILPKKT